MYKGKTVAKGILFFSEIRPVAPSTLITFGNPPLGTLFITAKAEAGLDWPVRLLVTQDDQGACGRYTPTSNGSPRAAAFATAMSSSPPLPRSSPQSPDRK